MAFGKSKSYNKGNGNGKSIQPYELKKTILELRNYQKEKRELESQLIRQLDGKWSWIYSFLSKILPGRYNVLNTLNNKYVDNLNAQQVALIDIGKMTLTKQEELKELTDTLAVAKQEKWTIGQYLDYLTQNSNLKVNGEIREILAKDLEMLPVEAGKKQAEDIYNKLERKVGLEKQVLETLRGCTASLVQEFKSTIIDYAILQECIEPMQQIGEVAEILTSSEASSASAKDILIKSIEKTNTGLVLAIEAMEKLKDLRLGSPETIETIRQEVGKLEVKLIENGLYPSPAQREQPNQLPAYNSDSQSDSPQ